MNIIKYIVPYEGGFNSGEHSFDTIEEAIEAAQGSYGDIYMKIQIANKGKPTNKEVFDVLVSAFYKKGVHEG